MLCTLQRREWGVEGNSQIYPVLNEFGAWLWTWTWSTYFLVSEFLASGLGQHAFVRCWFPLECPYGEKTWLVQATKLRKHEQIPNVSWVRDGCGTATPNFIQGLGPQSATQVAWFQYERRRGQILSLPEKNVLTFLGCPKRSFCPSFLLEVCEVAKEVQGNLSLLKQKGT